MDFIKTFYRFAVKRVRVLPEAIAYYSLISNATEDDII